jgi:hypothetical protein
MGNTTAKSIVDNAVTNTYKSRFDIDNITTNSSSTQQALTLSNCCISAFGYSGSKWNSTTGTLETCGTPVDCPLKDQDPEWCEEMIKNTTVSMKNTAGTYLNTSSLQNTKLDENVSQSLENDITSSADSESVNLTLNPGSTEADSIVDNTAAVATELDTRISNLTSSDSRLMQSGVIENCGVGAGTVTLTNQAMIDSEVSSSQETFLESNTVSDLSNAVSSSATAVTKDVITGMLMWIAIIIGLVLLSPMFLEGAAFGGIGMVFKPLVKPMIIIAAILLPALYTYDYAKKGWLTYSSCAFAEGGNDAKSMSKSKCCFTGTKNDMTAEERIDYIKGKEDPSVFAEGDGENNITLSDHDTCSKEKVDVGGIKYLTWLPFWPFGSKKFKQGEILDSERCVWLSSDKTLEYGECVSEYRSWATGVLVALWGISLIVIIVMLKKMFGEKESPPKETEMTPVNTAPSSSFPGKSVGYFSYYD